MHIDSKRLGVLLAVHREGGIVAAADVLSISPSAVSQQIQRLEDEVGLDVIERTPTGAALTPAGRILARTAEHIEGELNEALRSLRPLAGQVSGVVAIGSFLSVLRAILVPFHHELSRDLPGVDLNLVEIDEIHGMAALRAGRLDTLVLERDSDPGPPPQGFVDTPLFDEPWVLVTPESAPIITSEHDLKALRWLRVPPGDVGSRAMARITAGPTNPVFVEHMYSNYGIGVAMVAAGLGSTVLPRLALVDVPLDGVRTTPLPVLGVRQLLLRHHPEHSEVGTPMGQTIARLRQWIEEHPLTSQNV